MEEVEWSGEDGKRKGMYVALIETHQCWRVCVVCMYVCVCVCVCLRACMLAYNWHITARYARICFTNTLSMSYLSLLSPQCSQPNQGEKE